MALTGSQIPQAWSERGYVPPEQLDRRDDEDEKGEAAYMRAFHESSKMDRVPNAAFYVNSPTARAYIARRDKQLFAAKPLSGILIPNPDIPSWRRDKEKPKVQASSPTISMLPQQNTKPTLQSITSTTPSPQNLQPYQHSISPSTAERTDHSNLPWSLEPRTGATGPPRMIR